MNLFATIFYDWSRVVAGCFTWAGPLAVRIVVGFSPGGAADTTARLIGQKLTEDTGQTFIIENRTGASGLIANGRVATSPPDGYTLLFALTAQYAVNPTLYPKLPYDSLRDYIPVSLTATIGNCLIVHPSLPVKSVQELVALAKARPGGLNYASAGNASAGHLAMELLKYQTGTDLVHIAFKGGGPQVISSVSGETAVIFTTVPASIQHLRAGRLIGLGVSTLNRDPALPEVPTIAESGVPGYESSSPSGMFAPAKTPKSVITRLNREILQALQTQEVKDRFREAAVEPVGTTPEEFGAIIKAEVTKWRNVIKTAGIRE